MIKRTLDGQIIFSKLHLEIDLCFYGNICYHLEYVRGYNIELLKLPMLQG